MTSIDRTDDPFHPFYLPVNSQKKPAKIAKRDPNAHLIRRRIEQLHEQRAIDKLFEV